MTNKGGNKFSQIPEWVIDADISDGAFRLYAVLLRYANQKTGKAYPTRETLAERLKKTPKSVSRYAQELVDVGAIKLTVRGNRKSNIYWVRKHQNKQPTGTSVSTLDDLTETSVSLPPGHLCPPHRDTGVPLTIPTERYPLNNSATADAETHPPTQQELIQMEKPKTPAKKKHPHQTATQNVYDQTGGAINFAAVMGIAKWLINERELTVEQTTQAIVAVYQQGKPIMKQTLGQHIDGHHRNQKTGYNEWADIGNQLQTYANQKGWLA